jgi:hypothetical protein
VRLARSTATRSPRSNSRFDGNEGA